MLDEAKKNNPDAWWWIKADGCDIVPGIAESTRGVWSGDVDVNDGGVDKQKTLYKTRLSLIENLCITNRESLMQSLHSHFKDLQNDKEFLHSG